MRAAAIIERLPDYFAWRDTELTATLQAVLVEAHCNRYTRVVQHLGKTDPRRAENLIARFSGLPDEVFMDVLMAPETGYRLGYDGPANVEATAQYLESVLTAEDVRLGRQPYAPEPTWSARGDRYFPGPGGAGAAGDPAQPFNPRRPYEAPRIDGVVVDGVSPRATLKLVHIAGEATCIAPKDFSTALDRISAALHLVREASPETWSMVRHLTDVIVVRSDPSAPGHYTSASTTLCLRRPVLRNPFVETATVSELADGLVHEAIHCACDIAEIHDGRWLADANGYELRIASPWTGRKLDLHTYLQACWVWYGLWSFWRSALERGYVEASEGARCLARAYRGFHNGAATSRLDEAAPYMHEDLRNAVETAQAAVRTQAGALSA